MLIAIDRIQLIMLFSSVFLLSDSILFYNYDELLR